MLHFQALQYDTDGGEVFLFCFVRGDEPSEMEVLQRDDTHWEELFPDTYFCEGEAAYKWAETRGMVDE